MQIQVNTGHNIEGREALASHVTGVVTHALSHCKDHVTRVEVHLTDQNSAKHGVDDKRCIMEARLEGRHPTAVSHDASSLHQAIDGAAGKLQRSLESALGKLRDT